MVILDFLFPPKCKICNKRIKRGVLCPFCVEKLNLSVEESKRKIVDTEESLDASFVFPYDNSVVKDLLFALKRKGNYELFKFAAELYLKAMGDISKYTKYAVVNVPRSRANVKKYGYDHVKLPCKIMCKNNKNLIYCPVLKRKGKSMEQKNLTARQRKNNVKGNFVAIKKDIPKNILLVDDVVTTASTAFECVNELKQVYPDSQITGIFLAHTS